MSSGLRLGRHTVDQGVRGGILHVDLKAEVLRRLASDIDDRRVRAPNLQQGDVPELLRPDSRNTQHPGTDDSASRRRGSHEECPSCDYGHPLS
jgi:hypothetical protein